MSKRKRDDGEEVRNAVELICCRPCGADEVEGISLTPLERQVVEMKESVSPTTMLFVACGYRVKIYGRDSQVVSRRCGIMHIPGQPFPYSSIPYTRVDLYVHRLVSMGYHVAFADQESAAVRAVENKSGIFKRTISQVYSRATLLPGEHVMTNGEVSKAADTEEGGENDPTETNVTVETENSELFMCFLRSDSNRLEVVLVSFVAMEKRRFMVETALQLEDIVNRFDIVEIIVVRTQKGKQEGGALAGLSEEYVRLLHHTLPLNFGPTGNGEEDGKTVSVTTLSANTPTESTDACIKRHLEPYHLDAVYERLSGGESGDGSIKRETPDGALRLDLPGSTLRALDVFHSGGKAKGSLLSMLDRCITVCGSRCLRKWLAAPSAETAVVTARQEAVSFLLHGKDGGVVEELLQECAKVGDVESTIGKLYAKRCGVLEYLRLLRMVRNTRLLASQIEKESLPSLLADSVGNLHCSGISSFLETHKAEIESTATNPLELFMAEGMTQPAQFVSLSASRDNALKALDKELDRIREVLKLPALEYKTISGTPFVIDVPVGKSNKAEKDWTVLSRTKTNVRYHTPDILQHNISLCAARERLFVAATEAWDDYQVRLSGDHHTKSALDRLIQSVASLDVLRSLSMVSRQPGYVCPNLVPYGNTERVALKKARHPVMEHLIPGGYVGCDVEITVGGAWLLTGPNMGGKSALMRMVALCVIMAHLGCYVPADSACIPIFTGVYCRMGASDSILDGSSTFLSEMSETSRILGSPHLSRSLVLMDELGRGTSSFDGAAVAASTLEFLLQSGATTIFVTHYNYICEPYQDSRVQSVECYYMGFEERTGDGNKRQLVFTYQPCKGITPSSFGVDVARQAGLPLSVTEAAKELSSKMEKELNFIVDGSKVRRFLQE